MEYIKKIRLTIPGLKQSVRLFHITDCHVSYSDENSSEEERANDARASVQWRPAGKPKPMESFRMFLRKFAGESHALTVMTGDVVDLPLPGFCRAMREELDQAGLPYLYVMGNHENRGFISPEMSKEKYYPVFSPLMQGTPDFQVIGYDENGVVCGDSPVFYVVGLDDATKIVTEEQLEKLKRLSAEGKPIVLCLHVPIATEGNTPAILGHWHDERFLLGGSTDCESTKAFCSFVKSEESSVTAVLAGHIHFANESEFAPGRFEYVAAPSFEQFAQVIELTGED